MQVEYMKWTAYRVLCHVDVAGVTLSQLANIPRLAGTQANTLGVYGRLTV